MIDISTVDSFGELLERMQADGVKTAQLIKVLGCNRQMIGKYLAGSKPGPAKLKKFAEAFGYSFNDLVVLTNSGQGLSRKSPSYAVRTQRGAMVGRMYENLDNEKLQSAVLELLQSLSKEGKTGST